ncbi:MAG: carboxypeptidase-like regulatory domain-containing protein [Candidatus Thermoplasmatota archaeon]|nr:carboxypeptidase-like regulatory domain-containing protein [Candidatus Thermoplasmatota archaeon]
MKLPTTNNPWIALLVAALMVLTPVAIAQDASTNQSTYDDTTYDDATYDEAATDTNASANATDEPVDEDTDDTDHTDETDEADETDHADGAGDADDAYTDAPASDHARLHVYVSQRAEDGISRAHAKVVVYAISETDDGRIHYEPITDGETEDGTISFELAPGPYKVEAYNDAGEDVAKVRLHGEQRLHLHIGASDLPHDKDPREHFAKLGVFVSQPSAHGPAPAPGAKVLVYKIQRDDGHGFDADPVARGETGPRGYVDFHLPEGIYGLRAAKGDLATMGKVHLDEDQRKHLHLHAKDRPQHDGPYNLGVAALQRGDDGAPVPAQGAEVVIEKLVRTDDGRAWDAVERGLTDENGHYTTALPKGAYKVTVTSEEGLEGWRRVPLRADKWVRVGLADHEGEASTPPMAAANTTAAGAFTVRDGVGPDDRPSPTDRPTIPGPGPIRDLGPQERPTIDHPLRDQNPLDRLDQDERMQLRHMIWQRLRSLFG